MTPQLLLPIIKTLSPVMARPKEYPVSTWPYLVDRDCEPLTRAVILETDPNARFVGDPQEDWKPNDGPAQDRLWIGERNNGPNAAYFDHVHADAITDYYGQLWVKVVEIRALRDGKLAVVEELYAEVIGWADYCSPAEVTDSVDRIIKDKRLREDEAVERCLAKIRGGK